MRVFGQLFVAVLISLAVGFTGEASTNNLGDGVNIQPSYFCSGDMDMGWSLMKDNANIQSVRIEMYDGSSGVADVEDFKRWIQEANDNGYQVIATYHRF